MKIRESQVTKILISGLDGLDPVSVIFEDLGTKCGKFIIECWGESWSHYWGGMADGHNCRQFFTKCNTDYLVAKCVRNRKELDYEVISKAIGQEVGSQPELSNFSDELTSAYGEDWQHFLPKKETRESQYFTRIVEAVKQAIQELETK